VRTVGGFWQLVLVEVEVEVEVEVLVVVRVINGHDGICAVEITEIERWER
jgi:hypothetical protein